MLLFAVNRSDRERLRAMEQVAVGEPAARVNELVGAAPTRCPAGPLDHLRESFPEGWSPAAIDVALEELEGATAERWLYPIGNAAVECTETTTRTEIGVTRDRTVVWMVPVLGRSVLELPPTVSPSGVDSLVAEQGSR